MIVLPKRNKYSIKDQLKANICTCFIGRGVRFSSSDLYREIFERHNLANKSYYSSDDLVFVSVNGKRRNRLKFNKVLIQKAIAAKSSFVVDDPESRGRDFNIGERELFKFIMDSANYTEEIQKGQGISILKPKNPSS